MIKDMLSKLKLVKTDPAKVVDDATVHSQLLAFAKKAEKLAETSRFTKFVDLARKELGGDGEVGLFFFTQCLLFVYKKTGSHAKAAEMIHGWLEGVKKQAGG